MLSWPININEGLVVVPADPNMPWEKFNLPVCELPTVTSFPKYDEPAIPTPPATVKAPEEDDVDAVVAVIANPEVDNIFVDGL